MKVADFHCDLLAFLATNRTAYEEESKASIPLLRQGKVVLQTLPIYSITQDNSTIFAEKQFQAYLELPIKYPECFGSEIQTILSIENASGLCEEYVPLEIGLSRLRKWKDQVGKIAYLGLTWNQENRFGGGCDTYVGLKSDGVELLYLLDELRIPVDLSHTSDKLAEDILNTIENKKLSIIPLASHSNFRKICPHKRNLPDDIAQAIAKKGGMIGLNFVRGFLGAEGKADFIRHIEHAHFLNLVDHFCLGADFFCDSETDLSSRRNPLRPFFYDEFDTAACYPKLLEFLKSYFPQSSLEKIAYHNLSKFLENL